jgi:hypothetical protein
VDIRTLRNRILGDYCLEFRLQGKKYGPLFVFLGPKFAIWNEKKYYLDTLTAEYTAGNKSFPITILELLLSS